MMKLDKFLEMINKALNSNTVSNGAGVSANSAPLIVQYNYDERIEDVIIMD